MAGHRNRFIDDADLSVATSLTHLLDRHDTDVFRDEVHVIKHSPYFSERHFSDLISNKPGLCILDLNIANIFTKFDLFKSFIDRVNLENPISAICLNECWIKENSDMSGLNLPNYKMFYQRGDRVGHGHCGLVIYVHEQFKCKQLFVDQSHTDWDFVCVEISHYKQHSKKYIIGNIYRLPGLIVDDFQTFVDEFSSFLTVINNLKHSSFICGDLNINLLQIDTNIHYNIFFDRITAKGFFPKITLPTRLSDASNFTCNTLIDNILTNDMSETNKSVSGILINDISDHKMIFSYYENYSYVEKSEKFIEIEVNNELSMQNFIDELKTLNIYDNLITNVSNSLHENYDIFSSFIVYAKDKHLPKKLVKYNKKKHKKSKWMTNGILRSINTKDKLYKILVQADTQNEVIYNVLKNNYLTYRATLRRSIRQAKRIYYTKTFNMYKNDIKKTWSVIKDTFNNVSNCNVTSEFVINDETICDPDVIANKFNEYFINIGRTLSDRITSQQHYNDYLSNSCDKRFIFKSVNETHILEIINKLKNKSSYGHDRISNKLIKRAKEVLAKPLTFLVNQMIATSYYPNALKLARVKPLFKSGDNSMFSNYRPISLLPSISKIFEYVMFHQLIEYFTINNLFCIQQFGFRPGHSTELAALRLVNHLITQMDNMKIPINIYIDLSKAFDTLNHNILLAKLNHYGICGNENVLLQNYLTNRQQYVEYNGFRSTHTYISTGVPQGSILGPLLFLIYINDLPLVSNIFDMIMYADDTTLYCNLNETLSDVVINNELNKISEWLSSNKLSLNIKKTKYMVFHTARRKITYPNLILNGVSIDRVTQFNFLGLIINSQLTWISHIQHISCKISKIIGVMYRLKHTYPQSVLLLLYNTLIVAHFNYCLLIWGSKIVLDHPIHKLQKRALRIIMNSDYVAHSEPLCKELSLLKVTDMFMVSLWKFYYKLMNNSLPHYFNVFIPELPRICDYHEIRRPTFHLPVIKHAFAESLISYQLVRMLNEEKKSILFTAKVHTHSFLGFKLYVKNRIIESYANHCYLLDCYSCNKRVRRVSD